QLQEGVHGCQDVRARIDRGMLVDCRDLVKYPTKFRLGNHSAGDDLASAQPTDRSPGLDAVAWQRPAETRRSDRWERIIRCSCERRLSASAPPTTWRPAGGTGCGRSRGDRWLKSAGRHALTQAVT